MVTFTRHRDLSRNRMIEALHGVKRAAAELLRFDGAYLRFSGEIRVEHYQGGEIVDQYVTEDAIWELMYFGHARSATTEEHPTRNGRTSTPVRTRHSRSRPMPPPG